MPTKAVNLSLIAGILILINSSAVGVASVWFPWIFPTLPGSDNNSTVPFATITIIGLVSGVLLLIGALMLYGKLVDSKAIGIVILVFSILSIVTGEGFIIGFILGIMGGVEALRWKSVTKSKTN